MKLPEPDYHALYIQAANELHLERVRWGLIDIDLARLKWAVREYLAGGRYAAEAEREMRAISGAEATKDTADSAGNS